MKKYSQQQLVALYIAERREWVRAVELGGRPFMGQYMGSESDRRAIEIMKRCRKQGFYEINGAKYFFEERRLGKFKEYKVQNVVDKPKQTVEFIERNGERIARVTYQ